MDKIAKLLKKLSAKECKHVENVLVLLLNGDTKTLDIKKLKGVEDVFRVRVGTLRIIFQMKGEDVRILEISRKDENTYAKY